MFKGVSLDQRWTIKMVATWSSPTLSTSESTTRLVTTHWLCRRSSEKNTKHGKSVSLRNLPKLRVKSETWLENWTSTGSTRMSSGSHWTNRSDRTSWLTWILEVSGSSWIERSSPSNRPMQLHLSRNGGRRLSSEPGSVWSLKCALMPLVVYR